MRVILTSEAPNKTSNIIVLWQCCSFLLSTVISHPLKFLGHFLAWGRMNPLTSVRCMSSHTGEDPQGGRILPFPARFGNVSTPISISQGMTSCALPKTEPAGDDLQQTSLRSTDAYDDVVLRSRS